MRKSYELFTADDILIESMYDSREFKEFSKSVSELTRFTDYSLYSEAVKDTTVDLRNMPKSVKKNTIDTSKDIINAYDNLTYAGSNLIKSSWDIVMRLVNLGVRILTFVINKITAIPKFILKTADRAIDIPSEIKAKVRGDITLHITASDIELIYNKLLMRYIKEYIGLATSLSKGEFWSTLLNKRINEHSEKGHIVYGDNDMRTSNKMNSVYTHLQNIEFKPSIIKMIDQDTVNIYFGDRKCIKFTDVYGKYHESTYYEALNTMVKDLESMKDELKEIHKLIGEKLKRTEVNQNFSKLNKYGQNKITTTLNQITKVVSIIGNFTKYIIEDINTINANIDKMLKGYEIVKVNAKKVTSTSADKINTNL